MGPVGLTLVGWREGPSRPLRAPGSGFIQLLPWASFRSPLPSRTAVSFRGPSFSTCPLNEGVFLHSTLLTVPRWQHPVHDGAACAADVRSAYSRCPDSRHQGQGGGERKASADRTRGSHPSWAAWLAVGLRNFFTMFFSLSFFICEMGCYCLL